MSDEDFIARFEDATLDPACFHHADHVRMAFLYLRRYPAIEALRRFSDSLMRFAASIGKAQLYHETITWAFLLLIRERLARDGGQPSWDQFAAQNPDLLDWKNNVLKTYYREETLKSDLARNTFLLPDRLLRLD